MPSLQPLTIFHGPKTMIKQSQKTVPDMENLYQDTKDAKRTGVLDMESLFQGCRTKCLGGGKYCTIKLSMLKVDREVKGKGEESVDGSETGGEEGGSVGSESTGEGESVAGSETGREERVSVGSESTREGESVGGSETGGEEGGSLGSDSTGEDGGSDKGNGENGSFAEKARVMKMKTRKEVVAVRVKR